MFDAVEKNILCALAAPPPPAEAVIRACDKLAGMLCEDVHLPLLMRLGMSREKAAWELMQAKRTMSAAYLEARLRAEFGPEGISGTREVLDGAGGGILEAWRPLGVLFHVSAGNVDALPVYSVIEGLLTGNVNLLKLPEGESGLSEGILEALFAAEPALRARVHVFDFRAQETEKLRALAGMADAVVLWGADEAVRSVRALAAPQTKLIEWGHRLSFAYVWPDADDAFLRGVAHNMCFTSQLYCSSAQGVYVDLDPGDADALLRFGERFLTILEKEACTHPARLDALGRAGVSLGLYADSLEAGLSGKGRVLRGEACSVTVCAESALMPARGFGNCWVKPLPREDILRVLRPHAGHLQTVALCCEKERRAQLERLLLAAGAARITDGARMSEGYCGMPRDGIYPLARYMKRVGVARETDV